MSIAKKIGLSALVATTMLAAVPASAGTITQTFSIPSTTTNWSAFNNINKYDTANGPLLSILVSIAGTVTGSIKLESLDAEPANLTATLQASQSVNVGAFNLVNNLPAVTQNFAATAFDGNNDFGGTSGVTFTGLTGSSSNSALFDTSNIFWGIVSSAFSCTGVACATPLVLTTAAAGTSNGSGAGNLVQQFNTAALADVTVVYEFGVQTPEPASMAVLGAGLLALGATRRRRK